MKIRIFILLLLISGLLSCEEKIDWDLKPQEINTIVIDALITNEYKYQTIKLTRPFSNANGEPVAVSGAQISISVNDASLNFIESAQKPGLYYSQVKMAATVDKVYTLTVEYEEKTYTAETYMIPVIPTYPLQIVPADNSPIWRKLVWTAPQYNPYDLAMYQVDISWTHLIDPEIIDTVTYARMFRYTLNTVDVNNVIFPQDKEEVYFPKGSYLIAQKFSVNDDYGNYLRALLAETEWQGSLFEEIRGNLPTNISNGGLGYFSACSVVADTLVVE